MLPISNELKRKLQSINQSLHEAYPLQKVDRSEIRARLTELGTFFRVEPWPTNHWKNWLGEQTLIGIDGSVNSTPGDPLRTISIFQALAKGTKGEEKWFADVKTPLLPRPNEWRNRQTAQEAQERGAMLAELELEAAQFAICEWHPRVILMDGSLFHFLIHDHEQWARLAQLASEQHVLLCGIAEEMHTHRLAQEVLPEYPLWSDRDLLYGILQVGEAFLWEDWSPTGSELWKLALRASNSPVPIGVDGLKSQQEAMEELVQLVCALTPKQGRGIPFWLDIVDSQVRVTNPLIETLIEEYIDPDLRHYLLKLKRKERMI